MGRVHDRRRAAARRLDYIQGFTQALRETGHALTGFELRLASDVPLGSGLSSSAAIEVAVLRALREAFELAIDDTQLALLGQRVENELVGAPMGAMDQMFASLGEPGTALFIDMQSLYSRRIPLPRDMDLLVISSGIQHDHALGDYRTRRAECEQAARLLNISELRELDIADLSRVAKLPALLDRRVRHVITSTGPAALPQADRESLRDADR